MNIDLIPNGAIKRVHVSQNDVGRTLTFELFNGSSQYTIPVDATVKIQGTKPSGFGFSETCTVSGNIVTVDTTEEMTDEYGYIDTELQITYSGNKIGTSNFVLAVERNPHPDTTTDGSMDTIIPELTLLVNEVKGYAEEIEGTYHAYGSPWVASTVAEMTDTDKIYVYTGSETGYVNGNWYYYNGSAWVSGGVYNAVAVNIDDTLTVQGACADAKAVGDEVSDLKSALDNLQNDVVVEEVDGEWFQNRAMISGGVLVEVTATNFCHSGFLRVGKDATISIISGYKIYAWKGAYSEFGHPAAGITSAWTEGTFTYTYDSVNPYLMICVMKSNSSTISPTEASLAVKIGIEGNSIFATKEALNEAQAEIDTLSGEIDTISNTESVINNRVFPKILPSIGIAKSTLSDDTMWAKYQSVGLSAVRFSARWDEIELAEGVYTWTDLDAKVAYAEANSLQMLIILISRQANTIYGTTKAPLTATQKVGWANFTSALFNRYKNKGIIYEVWNEPYLSSNWEGTAYDYAYLANTTAMRMRSISGAGKIATGCLHIDAGDFAGQLTSEDMIANNCVRYADYLSIHVYKTTAPIVAIKQSYIFFKKLLGMYGYGDTPIIISEIGYANSHESIAKDVPDELKLAYIPQIPLVARYVFDIPYTFIYTDVTSETNKSLAEYWYGIFGADGSATDYTTALANIVSQLQNLEFVGYKRVCSVNHALAFRKTDGTYIIFYWNTGATFSTASGGGYTVAYNNLFGWLNGQNVVFTTTIKNMTAEEIDINEFNDNIGQMLADSEESQDVQVARLGTTKITETQLQQLLALIS